MYGKLSERQQPKIAARFTMEKEHPPARVYIHDTAIPTFGQDEPEFEFMYAGLNPQIKNAFVHYLRIFEKLPKSTKGIDGSYKFIDYFWSMVWGLDDKPMVDVCAVSDIQPDNWEGVPDLSYWRFGEKGFFIPLHADVPEDTGVTTCIDFVKLCALEGLHRDTTENMDEYRGFPPDFSGFLPPNVDLSYPQSDL